MRRLLREQSVVSRIPRGEAVVEACSSSELVVDIPVRERAGQEVRVVERGVADAHVAPIDHAGEGAVVHEQMRRSEVGVDERGLEADECLHLVEESSRLRSQVAIEDGEDEPLELRALLPVRPDPVVTCNGKRGWIQPMERLEEGTDSFGVLVDERLATDRR